MIELEESLKWAFASLGAAGSFYVIDLAAAACVEARTQGHARRTACAFVRRSAYASAAAPLTVLSASTTASALAMR